MTDINKSKDFRIIKDIKDGYSVCGGQTNEGWYGGILVLDEGNSELYHRKPEDNYQLNLEH